MTKANFRRTLVGAAVAAALGVVATPVAAAPYRGVFDPTNFAGEYIINVSAACIATDGWHANTEEGICAQSLFSAYADVVSDDTSPYTYTGRLNFAPPAISSSSVLFGIYSYGGLIRSFDTDLIPHNGASPSTDDDWWIQFTSGHACYGGPCEDGPPFIITGALPPDPSQTGVYLYLNSQLAPIARADFIGPAVDIGGTIPEPGTIGLVLGGLAGGWLARRRRRKEEVPDSS
jgi:hypothetical protein